MAILVVGKTKCTICKGIIESLDDAVAFPAFVPEGHEFSEFSDGVFHKHCFLAWEDHDRFQCLYENYERVWKSRPSNLSFEQIEEWGRHAFAEVFSGEVMDKSSSTETQGVRKTRQLRKGEISGNVA
jgi:hypothetical protein